MNAAGSTSSLLAGDEVLGGDDVPVFGPKNEANVLTADEAEGATEGAVEGDEEKGDSDGFEPNTLPELEAGGVKVKGLVADVDVPKPAKPANLGGGAGYNPLSAFKSHKKHSGAPALHHPGLLVAAFLWVFDLLVWACRASYENTRLVRQTRCNASNHARSVLQLSCISHL